MCTKSSPIMCHSLNQILSHSLSHQVLLQSFYIRFFPTTRTLWPILALPISSLFVPNPHSMHSVIFILSHSMDNQPNSSPASLSFHHVFLQHLLILQCRIYTHFHSHNDYQWTLTTLSLFSSLHIKLSLTSQIIRLHIFIYQIFLSSCVPFCVSLTSCPSTSINLSPQPEQSSTNSNCIISLFHPVIQLSSKSNYIVSLFIKCSCSIS